MVSEDSPLASNSSILHQFIMSNSIPDQTQFGNQVFNGYSPDSIPISNPPYHPNSLQFLGDRMSRSVHGPDESDISQDRRLMDLLGTSNEPSPAQRLSLSLGTVASRQHRPDILNPSYHPMPARESSSCEMNADYSFASAFTPSCSTSESFPATLGDSKYLKPAQALLQEMVTVSGKDVDAANQKYMENLSRKGPYRFPPVLKADISNAELLSEKHASYLNLLKLLTLLEEVERRYAEYYHHMEELVSSFEMMAGLGTGKSYTALALQAMSKHFSSLRTGIVSQIRATKQKIERDAPKMSSRLSQLSLLDQEARQNRISLQQIGLMHSSRQTWRPIRGLPETSVTILRAWLFEHFLHPYPNESEKLMLASQTGLSKNQVSNWFINARVRLWKPMIEEMYKEEFGESSTESDQPVPPPQGKACLN